LGSEVAANASAANPTLKVNKTPIATDNSRLPLAVFKCGSIDSSSLCIPMAGNIFFENLKQSACQLFLAENAMNKAYVQTH
jgi:hypothetical protein